jgi:hypothetical protein
MLMGDTPPCLMSGSAHNKLTMPFPSSAYEAFGRGSCRQYTLVVQGLSWLYAHLPAPMAACRQLLPFQ